MCSNSSYKLIFFLFITWTGLGWLWNARCHGRNPNGILGLLCREHFPGLVEYAGMTGPAYIFDHYTVAPDAVDWDNREFNNKVEPVKQELWVPRAVRSSSWTCTTRHESRPSSATTALSLGRR
jgi:hypothetical protein